MFAHKVKREGAALVAQAGVQGLPVAAKARLTVSRPVRPGHEEAVARPQLKTRIGRLCMTVLALPPRRIRCHTGVDIEFSGQAQPVRGGIARPKPHPPGPTLMPCREEFVRQSIE